MTKTKRVRWYCASCGSFVLGPRAPHRDNACRCCLDCSPTVGPMVKRHAPVLERQRATATDRRRKRARTKKARKDARYRVGRLDIRTELRRIADVMSLGRQPKLTVHRRHSVEHHTGWAWFNMWRMHLSIPTAKANPEYDPIDAVVLLVHEYAHLLDGHGNDDPKGRTVHGVSFIKAMQKIAREVYDVEGSYDAHSTYREYQKTLVGAFRQSTWPEKW